MRNSAAHRTIPFFVPHAGCPHDCIFCAQDKITATARGEIPLREELARLHALMARCPGGETELAFFGGSFTAIEPARRAALLDAASGYVRSGAVSGIRVSTRPDCISRPVLEQLKAAGVTAVELGVQSTDDAVLRDAGRGHTARDSRDACALVREYGFSLVGQMMVGLPGSDAEKEAATARDIAAFGCGGARIYPTVVFAGTALWEMTLAGAYRPLGNEEAAARSADCLEVFVNAGVNVLRIGLHASEALSEAPFGPVHPAVGQLAEGLLYRRRVAAALAGRPTAGRRLTLLVPPGAESKAAGHKRANTRWLLETFALAGVSIYPRADCAPYTVKTILEE